MLSSQRASSILHILDFMSTLAAIALIGFTFYLLPYLLMGYHNYEVPSFIVHVSAWYEQHRSLSDIVATIAILGPFILASIAFIYIAKLIALSIESHEPEPGVPHIERDEYEDHRLAQRHDTGWLSKPVMTIIALMLMVFLLLFLTEYLVISQLLD